MLIFLSDYMSPYRYCQLQGGELLQEREFADVLRKEGWRFVKQKGSHQIWEDEEGTRRTLAWPHRDSVSRNFIKILLKKFNIPLERLFSMPATKHSQEIKGRFTPLRNDIPPANTLARLIYESRKAADMSRGTLGELLGVTRGAVDFWENNSNTPEPGRLQQMADLFDWTDEQVRVVKGLRQQIVIKQTGPLPTQIENQAVATEEVSESTPADPEKQYVPRRSLDNHTPAAASATLAEPEVTTPAPLIPVAAAKPEVAIPEPAATKSEEKLAASAAESLTASVVSAFLYRLEMENKDLKERLAIFESLPDLDMLLEKAHRYDRMLEITK